MVWEDVNTGERFFGADSGCSCPTPFEDFTRASLTPVTREAVEAATSGAYWYDADERTAHQNRIMDFMSVVFS